jgi:hypothetical protein
MTQIHVTEQIEYHHFTPFATLLFQLPDAIRKVFGTFDTQWFWAYDQIESKLVLTVYWIKSGETYGTARRKTYVEFARTAYSNAEIFQALSTASLDNTSPVQNV